ncbi:hypothetical protein RB195_015049 [Necator americanus]|uniref:Uncharacterized protein n=1 Tax=Necator americanus TaxID=51031 RepID=A0ABR1E322_NECAM
MEVTAMEYPQNKSAWEGETLSPQKAKILLVQTSTKSGIELTTEPNFLNTAILITYESGVKVNCILTIAAEHRVNPNGCAQRLLKVWSSAPDTTLQSLNFITKALKHARFTNVLEYVKLSHILDATRT